MLGSKISFQSLFLGAALAVSSLAVTADASQGGWENGPEATGETDPDVTSSCDYWANDLQSSDTCQMLEDYFGITLQELINWNPSLRSDSCILESGLSYCVSGSTVTSTSAVVTATPVATVTYSSTAAPVQSGITKSCTDYYLVRNGDTCYSIQDQYMDYTLQEFYSWNPSLKDCNNLVDGDYVCVAAKSSTTSSSSSFSTQTGVTSKCNRWHYVSSNDTCSSIQEEYGVTPTEFYNWNPATGANCTNLWLKVYVCVGIPGFTSAHQPTSAVATKTTMQTTTSTGAVVPSPVQTGITASCTEYYKVQSGDTCDAIEQERGVSAADFLKWNPAVGSACSDLEKNVYVCVGVSGSTSAPQTTSAVATRTTKQTATSTGAIVPSPVQTGITTSCTEYYKVQSGDTCYAIEQERSISAADFLKWNPAVGSTCADLEKNVYVCVAV